MDANFMAEEEILLLGFFITRQQLKLWQLFGQAGWMTYNNTYGGETPMSGC